MLGGSVVLLHISRHGSHVFIGKHISSSDLVDYPLYLAHVDVALLLRGCAVVGEGILTKDIEEDAVGHNHLACHQGALLFGIELLVEGIVLSKIFVETESYDIVANNNALVE